MYCNKCGSKLDNDAVFCVNCGTRVENRVEEKEEQDSESNIDLLEEKFNSANNYDIETKKNKKNVIRALIVGVVAILILFSGFFVIKNSFVEIIPDSRIECNYNNGGFFTYDDSSLYFIGLYNDTDEDTSVYSTTINGTNKTLISDNKNIKRIRVYDDKIIYAEFGDDNYIIGMMDKDGSNNIPIITLKNDSDNSLQKYDIRKDVLYYLYNDELHSCNLEGKEDSILESGVDTFTVVGGKIYYSKSEMISVYDIKKAESQEVCGTDADELVYDNGILYFKNDDGIYYVSIEELGAITKVVSEENISKFLICDDGIYYIKSLSSDEITALAKYMSESDDDYFTYALAMIGVGQLYKVDKLGMKSAEVVDTSELLMFTIYGAPSSMYCKISAFSNEINKLEIK